jgi:ATP-dependent Clp protease ATP-binding subunit ClpC
MEVTHLRPLTSRTRVALAIARGLAAARGDRDLTATHVVVGILREGGNPALSALWYAGMSENAIRRSSSHLEHSLGNAPGNMPARQVTIDLTPGEQEVLRLSDMEADQLEDPYVGTEHILLAILRSGGPATKPFVESGISLEKYYAGLLSSRRGDPPPDQPRAV